MIGTVSTVRFGYAFIHSAGKYFFVHATQMPADDVGRRYLVSGEEVSFTVGQHNGRSVATNVELLQPRATEDLAGYYEEGQVSKVGHRGEFCYVLRPFGGCVMLHWKDVKNAQSKCEYGIKFFVGQEWRYEIAPPISGDDTDAWIAKNAVEICRN
jgi:cold shock CspA family protein